MNRNAQERSVLAIKDLTLNFRQYGLTVPVLKGISLQIGRGERVALVGESGSGKSVTARIVLGLLQRLGTARIGGSVTFEGRELLAMKEHERAVLRGTEMSMIFQDPTSSLNPVFDIGTQFVDVLRRRHPSLSKADGLAQAEAMLDSVSIHDPARTLASFPFQLSGGMNQRVMIAMALANEPKLLIADEPGTALDVTVQAQTLRLMRDLVERRSTSVLFISHHLGVVREFADHLYVIYRGQIVEQGRTEQIFAAPSHPYTQSLLAAVPRLTGGGIPDIPARSAAFDAPLFIHPQQEVSR